MAKRKARPGDVTLAIGYVRASTDEQALSPQAQAAALDSWAAREGIRLLAVFTDLGVSGATAVSARPGLVGALAALRTLGAGVLVASARSRLARQASIADDLESEARKAGAVVRTADGTSDAQGSAGVLTRGMQDVVAAWERAVIRERTTAALAVKRARGERVGTVPFGFALGSDGVQLVPDAAEQAVIARVLELRASGLSEREIVRALAAEGLGGRSSGADGSRKPLAQPQVHRILARYAPSRGASVAA